MAELVADLGQHHARFAQPSLVGGLVQVGAQGLGNVGLVAADGALQTEQGGPAKFQVAGAARGEEGFQCVEPCGGIG